MNLPTQTDGSPAHELAAFIGRILLALIFVVSGIEKVMAPSGTIAYIASAGVPAAGLAYAGAAALECLGGLALLVGWQVRWCALLLAIFTVVAALVFHHALADQNQAIHFLKNLAMAGGLLQLYAFGNTAWSVDARRSRQRR